MDNSSISSHSSSPQPQASYPTSPESSGDDSVGPPVMANTIPYLQQQQQQQQQPQAQPQEQPQFSSHQSSTHSHPSSYLYPVDVDSYSHDSNSSTASSSSFPSIRADEISTSSSTPFIWSNQPIVGSRRDSESSVESGSGSPKFTSQTSTGLPPLAILKSGNKKRTVDSISIASGTSSTSTFVPPFSVGSSSSCSSNNSSICSSNSIHVVPAVDDHKKAKHRSIDANRRAREASAVARLQNLTCTEKESANRTANKRDKVTTLEMAGDKITDLEDELAKLRLALKGERTKNQQLTQHLTKMTHQSALNLPYEISGGVELKSNGNAFDQEVNESLMGGNRKTVGKINQLVNGNVNGTGGGSSSGCVNGNGNLSGGGRSFNSSSMVGVVDSKDQLQRLIELESSRALYNSTFLNSSIIYCVFSCYTGRVVDVNRQFSLATGWKREEVLGRVLCTAVDSIPTIVGVENCPLAQTKMADMDPADVAPVRYDQGKRVGPPVPVSQYPNTEVRMAKLHRREEARVEVIFRLMFSRGTLAEVQTIVTNTHTTQHLRHSSHHQATSNTEQRTHDSHFTLHTSHLS